MKETTNKKCVCVKRTLAAAAAAVFALSACVSCNDKERDEKTAAEYKMPDGRELVEIGADSSESLPEPDRGELSDIEVSFQTDAGETSCEYGADNYFPEIFSRLEFESREFDSEADRLEVSGTPVFSVTAKYAGGYEENCRVYPDCVTVKAEGVYQRADISDEELEELTDLFMALILCREYDPLSGRISPAAVKSGMRDKMEEAISDGEYYEVGRIPYDKSGVLIVNAQFNGDYYSYSEAGLDDNYKYHNIIAHGGTGYEVYGADGEYSQIDITESEKHGVVADSLIKYYEPAGTYAVESSKDIICEKFDSGSGMKFFTIADENGDMKAAIFYNGEKFEVINDYTFYDTYDFKDGETLKDQFESVKEKYGSYNPVQITDEISFNADNKFDFDAEKTVGDEIKNPHIVDSYRKFFDSAEEFTVHITSDRGDYLSERFATQSADGYYCRSTGKKGGETAIISEELMVGGNYYMRCHYYKESMDYTRYAVDEYTSDRAYVGSIIQRSDLSDDEFIKAYNVTVGGEEYICEVWHTGATDFKFYCKDDKIVAFEAEYAIGTENSVIEIYSDKAQTEYIAEPETSVTYSEENFAQQ